MRFPATTTEKPPKAYPGTADRYREASHESSSQYGPAITGTTILIVDDEAPFRRALRAALHSCGYQTHDVPNGREALDHLQTTPPDLVLLDMNMPGLSGVETCRAIREVSRVPVVILSVRSTERDKQEAFDAGANDYITKPFSIRELLDRIEWMLR